MNVLDKIKDELDNNTLHSNFKTNIIQVSEKYSVLNIFDSDHNEINIIDNNDELIFRVSGFESSNRNKISILKQIIHVFQFFNRKNQFDG